MQNIVFNIFITLFLYAQVFGQMLNPNFDKTNEPFCYFSQPTDVIGVMDGREATLVSPEGYFYTGWGELIFFTGNPPQLINQRVKTLKDGYLPINNYSFTREKVKYKFEAFAATLDGNPESRLYNFVKVTIKNLGDKKNTYFSVASRYQNEANTDWGVGDNRFGRPVKSKRVGAFEQLGDKFSQDAIFNFTDDGFIKDGKLLYLFPMENIHRKYMTFKTGYNEIPNTSKTSLFVLPTTPVGIIQYKYLLEKDAEVILEFKFPYLAEKITSEEYNILKSADYLELRSKTEKFWNDIFDAGIKISVPEEKINNTFKASLVYDLIAREKQGDNFVQKVNQFQYDAFWLRDASFVARMYDLSGYHKIAGEVLNFFPKWQKEDGNFVSQGGQYDGWGQVMWAYGQHYLITKDIKFAEWAYPQMKNAFNWLRNIRKTDQLNIIPVTTPGDNEDITGHVTGHNFWALAGLQNIILVAEALGKDDEATILRAEYNNYYSVFENILLKITSKTNGYITPGIDEPGGQDWGNMGALYPVSILDKESKMVLATVDSTRAKYQEGIMTYGDGRFLHHYLTIKNTETQLIMGAQKKVIEELYSILMHTGSTHSGFEYTIRPWGIRDFGMNLSPHGWFAAEFRTLIRNMLIREEGNDIHFISAISPEWVKDGSFIEVNDAPTNFGISNLRLSIYKNHVCLNFNNLFETSPNKLIIHLPWFMNATKIIADGEIMSTAEGQVEVPINTKEVIIYFDNLNSFPKLNYKQAIEDYKLEYKKKFLEFSTN